MVQALATSEQIAPRVRTYLLYNGQDITWDIAPFMQEFRYTDHAGSAVDEISLDLENIASLWDGQWTPAYGDSITATLVAFNWEATSPISLVCGTFQIDGRTFDGPPDGIKLQALSAPMHSGLRRQRKHRSWEGLTLRDICQDIASNANLQLYFDSPVNPRYERKDQHFQTDLAFLQDFTTKCGLRLKISDVAIIIFDEATYEQKTPVVTIDRNSSEYTHYEFRTNFADVYRSCSVNWHDAEAASDLAVVTFTPSIPPPVGETLEINERVESAADALILARARLREKNRNAQTARFTLPLNLHLVGAATVHCSNWSTQDDGIYMVDSVTHTNGQSGSTSEVELHKILVGY